MAVRPFVPKDYSDAREHRRKLADGIENLFNRVEVLEDKVTDLDGRVAVLETETVTAGYAGLILSAPSATAANITPTPTKITGFDTAVLPEIGASASVAGSTITFNEVGRWVIDFNLTFDVTASSANATREVGLEIWNETDGSQLAVVNYQALARYQALLTLAGAFPAVIDEARVGKQISLRVWSPSSHTIVTNQADAMAFKVFRVSNKNAS